MKSKIAVDSIALLSPLTGIGRYAYEISKRLKDSDEFELFFYYGFFSKKIFTSGGYAKIKSSVSKSSLLKRAAKKALVFYTKNFFKKEFDLYWQPNYIPDPVVRSKKCVVSVHDFSFVLNPSWHPKERIEYFEKNFFKNIKRADRIITGSNYSKEEIKKFIGVKDDMIDVIYHGVDHSVYRPYEREVLKNFAKKLKLPKKFFLFVGSVEPRKNLSYLLKSYIDLPNSLKKEYKLLIVGFKGWENEQIKALIDKERENIVYMGYLSDLELAFVYNLAFAFIYPSLYEGFGIPPLEAMACKTPVIVSNRASLPEVCSKAALYADVDKEEDLREKILDIVENEALREDLKKRGFKRAKEFSWDKSAKRHMEVFRRELS